MNIAIDYDDTYTTDPGLWYQIIQLMKNAGHNPFICTYRDERYDKDDTLSFLEEDDIEVVYTRGVAKKWWVDQFTDIRHVDIWCEDSPQAVFNNSSFNVVDLATWRANNAAPA